MAHLYCNGGNRFNFVSIRNYTQNNFGGGYSYGCSMPSFGGIFSNWGTGIYTGCACNGGWSWSAFAGNTFGSLVGNVLGMLWGGNNGLYSGIGYTSGSTQGQRTTGNNGNGKDTDFAKIDYIHKNINNPDNDVKDLLEKCELDDCEKEILKQYIIGKLEILDALEKGLDGVNDTENKTYIDNLRNQLKQLASRKGIDLTDDTIRNTKVKVQKKVMEEQATPLTTETSKEKTSNTKIVSNTDKKNPETETFEKEHNLTGNLTEPNNIKWNNYDENMIPSNWVLPEGYTQPDAKDISDTDIIKVEDTSKRTKDIPVTACKVSPAGKNTNNFPATLKITDSDGKTRFYHYVCEKAGCPVYITPSSDSNKNVYVLCKQGNEYKLMQFKDFSGYGKGDHQVK